MSEEASVVFEPSPQHVSSFSAIKISDSLFIWLLPLAESSLPPVWPT